MDKEIAYIRNKMMQFEQALMELDHRVLRIETEVDKHGL